MSSTSRMLRLIGPLGRPGPSTFVRLSPFPSGLTEAELDAAWPGRSDGFALAGAVGAADIDRIGVMLSVREAEHGLPDGTVPVVAFATDTAAGLLAVPRLGARTGGRLVGIAHDPEPLRAALGCEPGSAALAHARVMTLVAAAAAGVPAVLVAGSGIARAHLIAARRDGFAAALVGDDRAGSLARDVFQGPDDRASEKPPRSSS